MSVSASSGYFWKMLSKWQTTFIQFCELFSLSSQNTINSAFHIAYPPITNCDFSSFDHFLAETSGMPVQDKAAEVKNETRPQVASLLLMGAGERKVRHLSTTKRKHNTSKAESVFMLPVTVTG